MQMLDDRQAQRLVHMPSSPLCILAMQTGAMVAYVLDALRQKEGAFAAIWVTLGVVNLTLLVTASAFPPGRPVILGLCVMIMNGATLLITGKPRAHRRLLSLLPAQNLVQGWPAPQGTMGGFATIVADSRVHRSHRCVGHGAIQVPAAAIPDDRCGI